MCLSRKDAKVIRHRTARTVPLACEHAMRGLDERGMAPAPARQHRPYTGIPVFLAPWRENVFVTQRRKDAKVIRHRTARAVPLACRLQISPSRRFARAIVTRERHVLQEPKTREQHVPRLVETVKRRVGGPLFRAKQEWAFKPTAPEQRRCRQGRQQEDWLAVVRRVPSTQICRSRQSMKHLPLIHDPNRCDGVAA